VDCKPTFLSSLNFEGNTDGLSMAAVRVIGAGGTLVNLAVGIGALAALPRIPTAAAQLRYFVWLFATVNLFQGTGYLLFSGVAGIGDWASVIEGLSPKWAWRVGLVVTGGVSYFATMWVGMIHLGPFIGGERQVRYRRALVLSIAPYIAGSALYILSGLLNPAGMALVIASAVASSVGGTCGLVWAPQLLLGEGIPPSREQITLVSRSWTWIGTAGVLGMLFILGLGPGVPLQ
jgi:hypothetical protein